MTNPTIVAIFVGVYLVAVFAGSLAFLRMRRENQELRDRIEAVEHDRQRLDDAVHAELRSGDPEP